MPIYEYQCTKCGETFEAFQKISDDPLTECKFCQGKVEKLISQSSFQLKGSGWYLTDYARRSSSSSSVDKPKESAKPAETTSASTSTESKSSEKSAKSET